MARGSSVTRIGGIVAIWAISISAVAGDDSVPQEAKTEMLTVGAAFPSFTATDDAGQSWKLTEHTSGKVVVMYFYPGDFTGGCIKQAAAYREGLARLGELGVELVGVSGDEVATHKLFKETHGLRHTLLADPEGELAERLGIPVERPAKPAKVRTSGPDGKPLMDEQGKSLFVKRKVTLPRWTLIVGRDGKVVSQRMNVDPAKDAEEVMRIVNGL